MSLQIPILPEGSMLYSALAFCYRASAANNARRFVDRFYGNRGASHLNWFGAGAAFVSSQSFNGAASAVEILRRHTLFGYYSLGLGAEAASEWAAALAKGNAQGSVRYTRTFDPIATKAGLRCCTRCLVEDEVKGGLATWRLVHQLPFVQHCPVHLEPLVEQCPRCDVPLDNGRKFRLPGELCSSCGSPGVSLARMRPSMGYFRLLTRADEALRDQVDIYRPVAWTNAVRVFGAFYSSSNLAAEALSRQLCSLWATESVDHLWQRLGLKLRSNDLMQAISGTVASSPLTLQLATAEAMDALHPEIFSEKRMLAAVAPAAVPDWHFAGQRSIVLHGGTAIGRDRRDRARTRVLQLMSDEPGISRSAIWDRLRNDMKLLRIEDGAWLKQTLPTRLNRRWPNAAERTECYRSKVMAALSEDPAPTRSALHARLPKVMEWLGSNDKGWLEKALLPRQRRKRSTS
ncbi:MAG: hypothetical protein EON59_07665 [Alphaproteobacteria bacterium]|nr:MAG: hypothetical protein EON59_07665 [Alphaproteobacteria bacterium]